MQVSIYEATLVCRDVEIPDTCQKCGASFTDAEANNLLEYRLEDTVVATSANEEADSDDDIEESCEQVFITGYTCRKCKHVVHRSRIVIAEEKDD